VQHLRGPFDVGEEQCHGAARETLA
jgi:hypothetical protein